MLIAILLNCLCLAVLLATLPGCSKETASTAKMDTADMTSILVDASHLTADSGVSAPPRPDDAETTDDAPEDWPDDSYISPEALLEKVRADAPGMQLVNVSDEEFYNMGHIERSTKIPWDLLASRLDEVSRSLRVVLYCRRGVRTQHAYETLRNNGYTLVWMMEGGLEGWIAKGYPVVE